jgi:polysaccharide export outer membrane protein
MTFSRVIVAMLLVLAGLPAQQTPTSAAGPSRYRLGPGDEVQIRVMNIEELSPDTFDAFYRVDEDGKLTVPVVGTIQAGGMSLDELTTEINNRCKKYLRDPQVSVQIKTFKSQPVSVFGCVKTPGVFQLEGGKSIIEVLSLAGGLADNAGSTIAITRRVEQGPIPVANAETQGNGEYTVATLKLSDLMGGATQVGGLMVRPYDVITVPTSPTVYVLGCLKKPGGFMLHNHTSMSVLQAIAAAEGLDQGAAPAKARLLRPTPGGDAKMELPIDVKAILKGRTPDVALQPEDILYIPSTSGWKGTTGRVATILGASVTGALIYRY